MVPTAVIMMDLPKTVPAVSVLPHEPEPDEDLRAPPDDACQLDPRADLYGEMSPPADDFSAA
ncbi:MAG: hypothetical protein HY927_01600 [Elusimicrobia bacterium]|nr:hypothetical protein [Elusimicrobiota bacterium]